MCASDKDRLYGRPKLVKTVEYHSFGPLFRKHSEKPFYVNRILSTAGQQYSS